MAPVTIAQHRMTSISLGLFLLGKEESFCKNATKVNPSKRNRDAKKKYREKVQPSLDCVSFGGAFNKTTKLVFSTHQNYVIGYTKVQTGS